MATRAIDDTKLNDIAVAIQSKDNGGQMTVDEMPGRIQAIPSGSAVVLNPALVLWDWEGTKLAEYSRQDALALNTLPAPSTLPPYAYIDHELLVFQEWNWSLANIKDWIQAHNGETLNVGAIYTTTDGQNHNYWGNPRLDAANTIDMQKRGQTLIENYTFQNYYSLTKINVPYGVNDIGNYAFSNNRSLSQINLPNGVRQINTYAFVGCNSLTQINIPNGILAIWGFAFNGCTTLKKIYIPDSLTNLGTNAFNGCYSLKQIHLSRSLTSLEDSLFIGCCSLTKIDIPDSVGAIANRAFMACRALCDILNESQATLSNVSAFDGLPSDYRIYVPRANLSWFETATNWATIYTQGHIVAIEDYIEYLESIGFNVDAYKGA